MAAEKTTKTNEKPITKKPAAKKLAENINKATWAHMKKTDMPRILFASAEVNPFSQTGGLGEVAGSLPVAVNASGEAVIAVVTPLHECIEQKWREDFEFICRITVPVAWRNQCAGLYKFVYRGVTHYFIENDYYFKRPNLYGYYDDSERFAFFSRAILELVPYMDFKPNILHSNDWHTALVPVYYNLYYMNTAGYEGIRNLITIHNIEYQGKYDTSLLEDVFGIPAFEYHTLEWGGCVNLLYGAIVYSDMVSTVSRTYAQELRSVAHGCGLENVIDRYACKLTGILNGIDTEVYNPETAPELFAHYSAEKPELKKKNKCGLQQLLGLPEREDAPLITMVTRLAGHKGLGILKQAIPRLVKEDIQFVLLGTGEPEYESFFISLQKAHPNKVRALIKFDKDMSQKLFAAGDIYIMPSKSEPCGLAQMMAMRYGTIPVVCNVGGLADTVYEREDGNGFVATEHTADSLYNATMRAVNAYRSRDGWKAIVRRAMTEDWSWSRSGMEYIELYRKMLVNPK